MDKKFFIYTDENGKTQLLDISLIVFTDYSKYYNGYKVYFSHTAQSNGVTPYIRLNEETFNNLIKYIYNETK